jgi:NADPH:quinone reductase-like Zn-dependent oxidoreductase
VATRKTQVADTGHIKRCPTILGDDVAGVVIETGEGVTGFKKGDRVLASVCSQPKTTGLAGSRF